MATKTVPAKAATRISGALKRFQPILSSALARDVNESDTAAIVTDILAELFGYDKYHEVTSEHQIRGTYCDLAVALEGQLKMLIEIKAVGLDLKDKHLRQVVNYAANQGCEWVVLTNGVTWQVYKVDFGKPIKEDLVLELDFLNLNPRSSENLQSLYLLSREGLAKSALPEYYIQKQATGRHILGAVLMSEPILNAVRRELRKLAPEVRVTTDQIRSSLEQEVLKREIVEGEKADEARKKVLKLSVKLAKSKKSTVPQAKEVEEVNASVEVNPQDNETPLVD